MLPMTDANSNILALIEEACEGRCVIHEHIAEEADITYSTVNHWEMG